MSAAPAVVPLSEAADPRMVGTKAACLGRLLVAGFEVPDGVVVTAGEGWEEALAAVLPALGGGPLAVRSSAVAEDLPAASWAGLYATELGLVGTPAVVEAVRRCRASAAAERVAAYRAGGHGAGPRTGHPHPGHPHPGHPYPGDRPPAALPVLVQVQVAAAAAGVALTSDPLSGAGGEVVVTAVAGLGDRLTAGEAGGEEWRVGAGARLVGGTEGVLSAEQAAEVAAVARRVAGLLGGPQEVEWALTAGGAVAVLQSRPLTGLPPAVAWTPPLPGGWLRHFRLGEWHPGPVTPLFASWFLPRVEARFAAEQQRDAGFLAPPPLHVVVNGWYFHSPFGAGGPGRMVAGLLRRPRVALGSAALARRPRLTDRVLVGPHVRRWREEALPRYRAVVARAEATVDTAGPDGLRALVDDLAGAVGEQLWAMVMGGGSAWKAEVPLARFWRSHLSATLGPDHQPLLCALGPPPGPLPPHAVTTLDWAAPTLAEMGLAGSGEAAAGGHDRAAARRQELEAAAAAALDGDRRRRFVDLLDAAQGYARLREEQATSFTLAWPVLRRALRRLGEHAVARGMVERPDDVAFLLRHELDDGRDHRAEVAERRAAHRAQGRLVPPLVLGSPPRLFRRLVLDAVGDLGPRGPTGPNVLVAGMPASPGRATGPVRVVHDPDGLGRVRPGDVLVVGVAAPAWTAVFGRVAAVVSDGGSLAAHASLVAREYGIPAVVAAGDATVRLHDGQAVTVDGSRGTVAAAGLG